MSNFLVDELLPENEIHLVAGPSGAGKTRWLLHTLKQWETGAPVLGHPSHPCKWAYVASDRSLASVYRTMTGIGVDPATLNIIPAWGKDYKTLPQIFDAVQLAKAKLVVIESFGNFLDQQTGDQKSASVKGFLKAVQSSIEHMHISLIGVMESPKMKPYEKYENPRQRVSGAAAWAHYTETIFLVEPEDVADPGSPARRLTVCPRNSAGAIYKAAFDSCGRLIF
jgi:RecA-family ATPase